MCCKRAAGLTGWRRELGCYRFGAAAVIYEEEWRRRTPSSSLKARQCWVWLGSDGLIVKLQVCGEGDVNLGDEFDNC